MHHLLRGFELTIGYFYLALCYTFIFLPVVVLILFSFHDGNIPLPPFEGPTLDWYGKVLSNRRLMEALGNSVLVAVSAAAISCILGFLGAYAISRYPIPGKSAIQSFLILPLTVSYLIVAMGLLISFSMLNIDRSLISVMIGHVVINLPLAFAIILSQLGEHQRRFELAARDLGAGTFTMLRRVTLPMIMPAMLAAFFLCFTLSWDEFIIAFLLSRFDVTMPVVIWSMLRTGLNPETNAAGTLVFLISLGLVAAIEIILLRSKRT